MTLPVFSKEEKDKTAELPLFQGIQLGMELGGPAKLWLTNNGSSSLKLEVDLKNKYFPTFELGQATINKTGEKGSSFHSTGQYFKVGLNIPLSVSGLKAEDLFYVGLQYGLSAFNYDLDNLILKTGYWGTQQPINISGEHALAGWAEALVGIRTQLFGPVSAGWSLHYKTTIHVSNGAHSVPQYIPGYGQNVKPYAGISVHLYYRLPIFNQQK